MVYELLLRRGLLAPARSPVVRRYHFPSLSLSLPVHAARGPLHVTGNLRSFGLAASPNRVYTLLLLAERLGQRVVQSICASPPSLSYDIV